MIKAVQVYIFLLAIVVMSCSEKNQRVKDVSQPDSALLETVNGENFEKQLAGIDEPGLTYNERLGKHTYEKYCAVCHGMEGKGDGFNAYNLNPRPTDFTDVNYMNALSFEHIVKSIEGGGSGIHKSPLMPAWGKTIKPENIQRVAAYVRNFSAKPQSDFPSP